MPIYEYECTNCGKTFEIFQKIGDDPLTKCRECGGVLTKLISQCSFHLKGTGLVCNGLQEARRYC